MQRMRRQALEESRSIGSEGSSAVVADAVEAEISSYVVISVVKSLDISSSADAVNSVRDLGRRVGTHVVDEA